MKKLFFTFALLVLIMQSRAQSFQGIIKWSFTMTITDPKMKAQMEDAQKKMNDPANQAKMKEMEAKMNDPQFKAMMDSNPQLKAQMESAMKMMQSGDMSAMMPKGIIVKIKDSNTLMQMEGGMMANMEILYLKDKNQSYKIDRKDKTYSVLPNNTEQQQQSKQNADVKVTKTSETAKILGYTCTKYTVDYTSEGHTLHQILWSTTEIKDWDMKSMANQRMSSNQRIYFDKIDGVPLKVEMYMPQGNMVMEVKEINKQSLPASDFTIPSDFKEVALGFGGKY
ncbi:MAG TPA: DUF4412 domain-containing protein [Ohtaekwangia sp.]|uniref:DUF4412 domain-containing protein n=1 Tax=Ohtaekwangia sp. TaxID=2066019 RepID=UPI002F94538D